MDKLQTILAIWGAFAALCAVLAKALPAGKAQRAFAFLGSFAAPKAEPPQVTAPVPQEALDALLKAGKK